MDGKKIIGVVLLLFVVLSLAVLARREMGAPVPPPEGIEESATAAVADPAPSPPPAPQSAVSPDAAAGSLASPVPTAAAPAEPGAPAPTPVAKPGKDRVIIYYFHTTARCPTCFKIEEYTKEAVQTNFKDELKSGRLEFLSFNVDESQHQHFVKDYGLYTKSVVLSEVAGGKEKRFKNLSQIWELTHDKPAFIEYLTREIRGFLAGK